MSWLCIGKIKKAHHLHGELFLSLFAGNCDWFKDSTQIGLGPDPEQGPNQWAQLIKLRAHKDGFIAQLAETNSRNQAEVLKGLFVFINKNILISNIGEKPFLYEFLNFAVLDQEQPIGKVIDFSTNLAQDILVVTNNQCDFEIPFVKEFIQEIDYVQKQIILKLPNGLLEATRKPHPS